MNDKPRPQRFTPQELAESVSDRVVHELPYRNLQMFAGKFGAKPFYARRSFLALSIGFALRGASNEIRRVLAGAEPA